MARLYSNENFPLPVVQALRRLGHDVVTTRDAGKSDRAIPDPEVLAYAHSENRAVLTLNRKDFIALHNRSSEHSGIVVCTVDIAFEDQAARIHQTIEAAGELAGKILRVNRVA